MVSFIGGVCPKPLRRSSSTISTTGGTMSREPEPDSPGTEGGVNNATPADTAYRERITELCRQHEKELLRMLVGRVGSMQDARDIAQAAYVKLLALDRPGTVSFFAGYLWKIATNLAIDQARTQRRRNAQDLSQMSEPDLSAPSAESVCIAGEQLQILEKAIEELPPKCRMAFVLRAIDGLPLAEIARRMGIDISGVKRYVIRGHEHCQIRLANAAEQTTRSDK